MMRARSALVTTLGGAATPVPTISVVTVAPSLEGRSPVCGSRSYDPNVAKSRLQELRDELTGLVAGRSGLTDGIVSPIVFVSVNAVADVPAAAAAGLTVAVAIVAWRLARGRPLQYAVGRLFGTGLAIALAVRSGEARDYFLPGLISGAATTLGALASIAARRPLVAWTSWVTRGWPIDWYWHPRVRPAYTVVTWLWVAFFGMRTAVQGWLFLAGDTTMLGIVRVLTGWPGLVALLAATYVIGRQRLEALGGPSVVEFEAQTPPPWTGQQRGF